MTAAQLAPSTQPAPATIQPAPATTRRWHSWHLHAGSFEPVELESIVTRVVAPTITELIRADGPGAPVRPWFFMRYWQNGPHVRFRAADLGEERADLVTASLAERLAALPAGTSALDQERYLQAIGGVAAAGEGTGALAAGSLWRPGVYPARYEPEIERYGGPELIAMSEDLFRISSVVTMRACGIRTDSGRAFGDGLESMAAAMSAWPGDPEDILVAVRDFWTDFLRQAFPAVADSVESVALAKAELLRDAAGAVRSLVDGASNRWTPWTSALAEATKVWLAELGEARARGVFVSHLHMTQNRLGVSAGREAHVSATLLRLMASDQANSTRPGRTH